MNVKEESNHNYAYYNSEEELLNSLIDNKYYDEIKKIYWTEKVKKVNISKKVKIENLILPKTITEFFFDNGFNDKINDFKNLENAEIIYFGNFFNQPLDNVKFSDNLKFIHFSPDYRQPLHNLKIPSNTILSFNGCSQFNLKTIDSLPNIKYLYLSSILGDIKYNQINLPITLKALFINDYKDNKNSDIIKNFKVPFDCKIYIFDETIWYNPDFCEYTYLKENNLLN